MSVPEKITENFDFDDIEMIIMDKMEEQAITNRIQKILFSIQTKGKEIFFIGTVFISGFGMIKVNINLSKMEITDFEKSSFFDILKKVK